MEAIHFLVDFILHIDDHLNQLIQDFGVWTYLFLFLIVFIETGLVIMPFLPGDSLLFAVGTFAAMGSLDVFLVSGLLIFAAITGDAMNYALGRFLGPKIFSRKGTFLFNQEHLNRTYRFYEKYGAKTIILARFVPIVRTFAPFVAGIGKMDPRRFFLFNVFGGILWVVLFVFAGYFFGNIPAIKHNFSIVIMVIIFVSVLPVVFELLKEIGKSKSRAKK